MSKSYDRLEYVGKGKGIIIDILPSRVSIKVTKDRPYIFKSSDSLDAKSIKYYKSLESSGIKLHEIPNDQIDNVELINKNKDEKPLINSKELDPKVSEVSEIKSDDSKKSAEEVEKVTSEVVNDRLEASDSEIIEFLDMNYSEDDLRSIARNCGVKRVMSSWSKETLISKIVENNLNYVIDLMKNA